MEDQQSAPGDLSGTGGSRGREERAADELAPGLPGGSRGREEPGPGSEVPGRRHRMPVGKAKRAMKPAPAAVEGADSPAEVDTEVGDVPSVAAVPTTAVDPVPGGFRTRARAPRWAPVAVAAAAAVFVGAAAFAGAAVQPYLAERALVDTKMEIARTSAEAITTLWTYTPDNMESLADRSARFLGGDFEAQYRRYVDAIAPTNKQAQVSNSTQVVGAAVESINGRDATAIVYTNSTATSPLSKDIPSLRYLSYQLTLRREDSGWLVTSMNTVTSLDLTPQI